MYKAIAGKAVGLGLALSAAHMTLPPATVNAQDLRGPQAKVAPAPRNSVYALSEPNAIDPNYIPDPNAIKAYAGNVAYSAAIDPNLQVADVNAVSDPNTANFRPMVLGDTLIVSVQQDAKNRGYNVANNVQYGNETNLRFSTVANIRPESVQERATRMSLADANETAKLEKKIFCGRDGQKFSPVDPNNLYFRGFDYDCALIDPNQTVTQMLSRYAQALVKGGSVACVDEAGKVYAETLRERTDKCLLAEPNEPNDVCYIAPQDGLVSIVKHLTQAPALTANTLPELMAHINQQGFAQLNGKANFSRINYSNGSYIETVKNGFKGEETYGG